MTTVATDLIARLRAADIKFAVTPDGKLRYSAPRGVLDDAVRENMRLHRGEILGQLRAEAACALPEPAKSRSATLPARAPAAPVGASAAPPEPAPSPVPEGAEPGLRARLLAAAEARAFPTIVLPAFGLIAGREAWARLANRIGGRFLVEVLEEIQGTPVSRSGHRSTSPDRTGATPQ